MSIARENPVSPEYLSLLGMWRRGIIGIAFKDEFDNLMVHSDQVDRFIFNQMINGDDPSEKELAEKIEAETASEDDYYEFNFVVRRKIIEHLGENPTIFLISDQNNQISYEAENFLKQAATWLQNLDKLSRDDDNNNNGIKFDLEGLGQSQDTFSDLAGKIFAHLQLYRFSEQADDDVKDSLSKLNSDEVTDIISTLAPLLNSDEVNDFFNQDRLALRDALAPSGKTDRTNALADAYFAQSQFDRLYKNARGNNVLRKELKLSEYALKHHFATLNDAGAIDAIFAPTERLNLAKNILLIPELSAIRKSEALTNAYFAELQFNRLHRDAAGNQKLQNALMRNVEPLKKYFATLTTSEDVNAFFTNKNRDELKDAILELHDPSSIFADTDAQVAQVLADAYFEQFQFDRLYNDAGDDAILQTALKNNEDTLRTYFATCVDSGDVDELFLGKNPAELTADILEIGGSNPQAADLATAYFAKFQFDRIVNEERDKYSQLVSALQANAVQVKALFSQQTDANNINLLINEIKKATDIPTLDTALSNIGLNPATLPNKNKIFGEVKCEIFINQDVKTMPQLQAILNSPTIKKALSKHLRTNNTPDLTELYDDIATASNQEDIKTALQTNFSPIDLSPSFVWANVTPLRGNAYYEKLKQDSSVIFSSPSSLETILSLPEIKQTLIEQGLELNDDGNAFAHASVDITKLRNELAALSKTHHTTKQVRDTILNNLIKGAGKREELKSIVKPIMTIGFAEALLSNAATHKKTEEKIADQANSEKLYEALSTENKGLHGIFLELDELDPFFKIDMLNPLDPGALESVYDKIMGNSDTSIVGFLKKYESVFDPENSEVHHRLTALADSILTLGNSATATPEQQKIAHQLFLQEKIKTKNYLDELTYSATKLKNKPRIGERDLLKSYIAMSRVYQDQVNMIHASATSDAERTEKLNEIFAVCRKMKDCLALAEAKLLKDHPDLLNSSSTTYHSATELEKRFQDIQECKHDLKEILTHRALTHDIGSFSDYSKVKTDLTDAQINAEITRLFGKSFNDDGDPATISSTDILPPIKTTERFNSEKQVRFNCSYVRLSDGSPANVVSVQRYVKGRYQSQIHYADDAIDNMPEKELLKLAVKQVEDFRFGLVNKNTTMTLSGKMDPRLAEMIIAYCEIKDYSVVCRVPLGPLGEKTDKEHKLFKQQVQNHLATGIADLSPLCAEPMIKSAPTAILSKKEEEKLKTSIREPRETENTFRRKG